MEQAIKVLTYIHAFFGGVGLITGIGSIIVPKGQPLIKNWQTILDWNDNKLAYFITYLLDAKTSKCFFVLDWIIYHLSCSIWKQSFDI
jgi:hypothetical protein